MKKYAHIALGVTGVVALAALLAIQTFAFTGPSTSGGSGSGAIGVGTTNNVSFGTSTAATDTKLFVMGATAGASDYAVRVVNANMSTLAVFRDDGAAAVGTSTLAANTLTVGGNLTIGGTLAAFLNAVNISAGQFGASTGGGNFSFPAKVSIATTSAAYTLTVNGSVSASGNTIQNVGTPVNPTDAATKAYVDAAAGGGGWAYRTCVYNALRYESYPVTLCTVSCPSGKTIQGWHIFAGCGPDVATTTVQTAIPVPMGAIDNNTLWANQFTYYPSPSCTLGASSCSVAAASNSNVFTCGSNGYTSAVSIGVVCSP